MKTDSNNLDHIPWSIGETVVITGAIGFTAAAIGLGLSSLTGGFTAYPLLWTIVGLAAVFNAFPHLRLWYYRIALQRSRSRSLGLPADDSDSVVLVMSHDELVSYLRGLDESGLRRVEDSMAGMTSSAREAVEAAMERL